MNLDKIIKKGSRELKNQNIESYTLDAEIILSDLMGVSREFLITNEYLNIPKDIKNKYNFAIKRRVKKEPVAYITGKKEFWSENFKVSSATLVPRPETELLIYKVVNLFKKKKYKHFRYRNGIRLYIAFHFERAKNGKRHWNRYFT